MPFNPWGWAGFWGLFVGRINFGEPAPTYAPSTPKIGEFMPFNPWGWAGFWGLFVGRINLGEPAPTG
jgi:hypothetical protein